MDFTLEARWFDSDPVPTDLREWTEALGSAEPSSWTDLYLPSSDPGFNLKLREDKVQVKRRLTEPTARSLGPTVTGQCEQWAKWSFPLDTSSSLWEDDPTGLWVAVEKTRLRQSFEPDAQRSLSDRLPTSPPARVHVELTDVRVKGETAWTFCLETEGPAAGLASTLITLGPLLLDDFPTALSAEHSFGYVEWLQRLPTVSLAATTDVRVSLST